MSADIKDKEVVNKLITINVDKESGTVIVDIRGEFEHCEHSVGAELTKLRELSRQYSAVEIHIRSPGGSVYTVVELISIVRQFKEIITFGYSQIASAGSLLWACGDLRVIAPFSYAMFHRESFLSWGKVEEQLDRIQFVGDMCQDMMEELYSDILTEEEMISIRKDDLYITDKELINRGAAISIEQFNSRNAELAATKGIVDIEGSTFIVDTTTGLMRQVLDLKLGEATYAVFPSAYVMQVEESLD